MSRMQTGRIRVPLREGAPRLSALLRSDYKLPPVPERVDYLAQLDGGWKILGNDRAGDCEAVRVANDRRVVSHFYGDGSDYPDQATVWKIYQTQNPGFDPNGTADTNGPGSQYDRGMQSQLLLDYLAEHGMPDTGRKVVGWATVDLTDEREVDAALAIFGRLWLDVTVSSAQQQQFADGQPWDYDPNSPIEGGHAILGGGYSPDDDESMDAETWAQVVKLTDAFREHQCEQAFVVIWEDEIDKPAFLEGIDAAKAREIFQALTGRPFPGTPGPVAAD